MTFTLQNQPPRPRPKTIESNTGRQKALFSGLDCLAGQLDLLPDLDKIEDDDTPHRDVDAPDLPPERISGQWWFRVAGDEIGPYTTKSEATADYRGLLRTYRDNPELRG